FTATVPNDIYTLSLHDALPISRSLTLICDLRIFRFRRWPGICPVVVCVPVLRCILTLIFGEAATPASQVGDRSSDKEKGGQSHTDRKSTRLNSSHDQISYAVFC